MTGTGSTHDAMLPTDLPVGSRPSGRLTGRRVLVAATLSIAPVYMAAARSPVHSRAAETLLVVVGFCIWLVVVSRPDRTPAQRRSALGFLPVAAAAAATGVAYGGTAGQRTAATALGGGLTLLLLLLALVESTVLIRVGGAMAAGGRQVGLVIGRVAERVDGVVAPVRRSASRLVAKQDLEGPTQVCTDESTTWRHVWSRVGEPALTWLVIALVMNWVVNVVGTVHDAGVTHTQVTAVDWLGLRPLMDGSVDGWIRRWDAYDSLFYRDIAQHGYRWSPGNQAGTTVAWFPLYPLLQRWLGGLIGYRPAAVCISATSGLAAAVGFWEWTRGRALSLASRRASLLLLLLYPWSFMLYGATYADPLGLALVIGAFLLVERRRWVAAGLVGALATATRQSALPIVVGLAARTLELGEVISVPLTSSRWFADAQRSFRARRLRPSQMGVLLSLLGVGAFAAYCWLPWSRPLLFYEVQDYWLRPDLVDLRTWLKPSFPRDLWALGPTLYGLNSVATAAVVIGCLAASRPVARRFGLGYGVYVVGVAVVSLAGTILITPAARHQLLAFPVFALGGDLLSRRPRLLRVVLVTCAAGGVLLAAGFTIGADAGW